MVANSNNSNNLAQILNERQVRKSIMQLFKELPYNVEEGVSFALGPNVIYAQGPSVVIDEHMIHDPQMVQYVRHKEPISEDDAISRTSFQHSVCTCGAPLGSEKCCVFLDLPPLQFLSSGDCLRETWDGLIAITNSYSVLNHFTREAYSDTQFELSKILFERKVKLSGPYRLLRLCDNDQFLQELFDDSDLYLDYEFEDFISTIYEVREIMGDYEDHGMKSFYSGYSSQGVSYLMNRCASGIMRAVSCEPNLDGLPQGEDIIAFVRSKCSSLWLQVRQLCSFVSETVKNLLDQAFERFTTFLINSVFASIKCKIDMALSENRLIVGAIVTFCCWTLIRMLNILTDAVAHSLFNFAIHGLQRITSLVAQAPPDIYNLLGLLSVTVIGCSIRDFDKIKSYSGKLVTLMAGGTILANTFKTLLVLLPSTIKQALVYRFGTAEEILEREVEDWRSVTGAICAVSKIQSVLGSKSYFTKVEEQIKSGSSLIRRYQNGMKTGVRQNLLTTFLKLATIHTNLVTRKYSSGDRRIPFAFHVAGPPGIGKTTSVKDLLKKSCGFTAEEMYSKDVASEFFSGYLDHPVIVMDEFLLGRPDKNYDSVEDYLTMVSSGEWRPNFASVDDPNVGVKGNTARPKVVVTLNNVAHDSIDAKIDEAFQRRRRFVVRAKRSGRYAGELMNSKNVDFSKFTPEECRERVWCSFDILPGVFNKNVEYLRKDLTYSQLVDFVSAEYKAHSVLNDRIEGMNDIEIHDRSTDDIINDVLRDAYGIPSRPMGIVEAISTYFYPEVKAQGPNLETINEEYLNVLEDEIINHGVPSTILATEVTDQEDSYLKRAMSCVSDNRVLAGAAGLTAAVIGIVSVIGGALNNAEPEKETFYGQSAPRDKKTNPKGRQRKFQRPKERRLEAQGPAIVVAKLTLQGVTIKVIPLKDHWFLTYSHSIAEAFVDGRDVDVVLNHNGKLYDSILREENVFLCREEDICIFNLVDNRIPRFKNVIKHFIHDSEIDKTLNSLVVLETDSRQYSSMVNHHKNVSYSGKDGTRYELAQAARYQAPTTEGDCGIPIRIISGGLCNKILGLHVAGSGFGSVNPVGIATFVTQECIRSVIPEEVVCQGPNIMSTIQDNLGTIRRGLGFRLGYNGTVRRNHSKELEEETEMHLHDFDVQPNKVYEQKIPYNERVPLPQKTKLQKSCISEFLPHVCKKSPAILNKEDPRSRGHDPIDVSLASLYKNKSPKIDEALLKRVSDEIICDFKKNLNWVAGKRQLSFEEALKGVPGIYNSIVTATSPGYPLCHIAKKKGKTDFVWFEGSEVKYTEFFKEQVLKRIVEMEEYRGGDLFNRMLGFLKDELRTQSKIDSVKTRMIFANDMISLVAFRMKFGAVVAALQNSFECTGFAIGLNQYSADMNGIWTYLAKVGTNFGAGDYEGYDQCFVQGAEKEAYRVVEELAKECGVSKACSDYLYVHETQCPFQIGDKLVKVKVSNKSGCFMTTIINCIMNRIYFMCCFYKKFPSLTFKECIALVILGDDNTYSAKDGIDFTPKVVSGLMAEIGQKFTSCFKGEEVRDRYEKFEDIMFLGAIPRLSHTGIYTGALRKATLLETIQWTRDGDTSLDQTVQCMIDCASQWDQCFFEEYVRDIKYAYQQAGRLWTLKDDYFSLHYSVLNRTAASGADFVRFWAQGPVCCKDNVVLPIEEEHECSAVCNCDCLILFAQGPPGSGGLTSIPTDTDVTAIEDLNGGQQHSLASKSLNESEMNIKYGCESFVKRASYTWASTDAANASLANVAVPFGLLALGNVNNIQNMPFNNYIYFVTDVEIAIQINGTPTQQGAVICYFAPLTTTQPYFVNRPSFNHVFIAPNANTTTVLRIPFKFYRSAMNTYAGSFGTESLGNFRIDVWTPLVTGTLPTSSTITIYSRFLSKFTLPRPIPPAGEEALGFGGPNRPEGSKVEEGQPEERLIAQGASYSTVMNTNTYTITDVVGEVPVNTMNDGSSSATAEGKLSLKAVPYDNPPVSGCAIPTAFQYSSLSKANGLEPTVTLGMHQKQLCREPDTFRDLEETTIDGIFGTRGYLTSFTWATTDAEGTALKSIPLNSLLITPTADNIGVTMPPNLALLNQYLRWRGDFVFEIYVVRTMFHSGRLLATTAYGAPSVLSTEYNVFNNQVLEYNGDNNWCSLRVPYNAATEYLRTYEGRAVWDPVQDYSLGTLVLSVANVLRASSSVVATSVTCNIFVRLENFQVYGLKPISNTVLDGSVNGFPELKTQGPTIGGPVETTNGTSASTGGEILNQVEKDGGQDDPQVFSVTDQESPGQNQAPCKLTIGRKFEYNVKDIHENIRRHTRITPIDLVTSAGLIQNGSVTTASQISFAVAPAFSFNHFFRGWSGTLKYRIFIEYEFTYPDDVAIAKYAPRVTYVAAPTAGSTVRNIGFMASDSYSGASTSTWSATEDVIRRTSTHWPMPEENTYAVNHRQYYVDVSVPFNSHFNFLPTIGSDFPYENRNGYILISSPPAFSAVKVVVYQAAGDDFRYNTWCPKSQCFYVALNITSGSLPVVQTLVGTSLIKA